MRFCQSQSLLEKFRRIAERASQPGSPGSFIGKGENGSLKTRGKKAAFLREFGKSLSITTSAQLVGIVRTTHYAWLRTDRKYSAAFQRRLNCAADLLEDYLVDRARNGVFEPLVYKGRHCHASRERTICQLADGTSAFADELPKGVRVTSRRTVRVHDGEMLGMNRRDTHALRTLLKAWYPEFAPARRPKRKKTPG